jgi:hypothetical protein
VHTQSLTITTLPTPRTFGVGARITIAVMSSDYIEIIQNALTETDATGLDIETDNVSTWVAGDEQRITEYIAALIAAAARGGEHVTATVMLSRGCPGEISCELPPGRTTLMSEVPTVPLTGVTASAQWALYPLDDQGSPEREPDHMRDIYEAVDRAKANGSYVRSDHYVTRLSGDVATILETVAGGWVLAGRTVAHVTTHVTISVNSPSNGAVR